MSNAILAYGNRADGALLSGGSWQPTLPLTNLQNRRLAKTARSISLDLAATQFDADLGQSRLVRVIALVAHNASLGALYRIRFSAVADFASTAHDTGWQPFWGVVYPFGSLPWGAPNWWTGQYSAEEVAASNATEVTILPRSLPGRYLRVEIDDAANADGYIEIGRLFIADGWQPVRNIIYGASLQWEPRTTVQEALSGAEYFDERQPARVAKVQLDAMTEAEAMSRAFEIQRSVGVSGEVLFVWDPDDTTHALRRQYLARLRALSAIENPGPDRWRTPFEIKELL